jgi:hypothetical protein
MIKVILVIDHTHSKAGVLSRAWFHVKTKRAVVSLSADRYDMSDGVRLADPYAVGGKGGASTRLAYAGKWCSKESVDCI